MVRRLITAFCLAILLLVTPAIAQSDADALVDRGNTALQQGDYQTALSIYEPLAKAGNARAQANLGNMYDKGWGVEQSYETGLFWLTKSADQQQPFGAFRLGVHYDLGQGVAIDRAGRCTILRSAPRAAEATRRSMPAPCMRTARERWPT